MVRNGGSLKVWSKRVKKKLTLTKNCIVLDFSVITVAFFNKDKNGNV